MKLYHRFSRFKFRRICPKRRDERIRWALRLQSGDLVNDCTGFNRVVREVEPECLRSTRGWAIYDALFTLEPHGGSCSLIHCGVEPALSREHLETEWVARYDAEAHRRWALQWYGDETSADYKTEADLIQRRLDAVKGGGHFLDERGIRLPGF